MGTSTNFVAMAGQGAISADNLNALVQVCSTVAEARGFIARKDMVMVLGGRYAPSDGGQGFFYWNPNSTAADDNGVSTIVPGGAGVTGAWTRFEAINSVPGLTILTPSGGDDAPTLATLTTAALLTGGAFQIQSSVSVPTFVTLNSGSTINITTGKTLEFNAGFSAPIGPAFTNALAGEGTVAFNPAFLDEGYPEWWGAVTGAVSTNCGPSITAAVVALPTTRLQNGAYYCQSPIIIVTNGRTLNGVASTQLCCTASLGGPGSGVIDPNATQIVLTSSSALGIVLGNIQSSRPSALLSNVTIRDLTVVRATASAPLNVPGATAIDNPASGFSLFSSSPPPCGVVACWTALCKFINVYTVEHSFGFYIYGTVVNHFDYCRSLRYTAGQNTSNDFAVGYFMDNSAPSGFDSGNASLYFNISGAFSNCGVAGSPVYSFNAGIQSYQGFTDTYVHQFETSNCAYGMQFNGRQTAATDYQTEDLHVVECVLDGVVNGGVVVQTGGPATAVQIIGCYVGLSNSVGAVGIGLFGVHGSVSVTGCQVIAIAGNQGIGFSCSSVSGINARSNIYTDVYQPIRVLNGNNIRIEDIVNVETVNPFNSAVALDNVTRGYVNCQIYASLTSVSIPIGVNLIGSSNSYIEVNMTQIQPNYIVGGASNKLVSNGTQITSTGTFSVNCLASGIPA